MPRRKKSAQSPARVPGGPPEGGSFGHHHTTTSSSSTAGHRLPRGFDGAMANNFSSSLSSSDKDNMVKSMREMFSHLDPEVIYIVLSESDFKVENAMDSLLELSVAAEVAVPAPSPVSGFERTAAALLSPSNFSDPSSDPDSSGPPQLPRSPPSTTLLTEDIDLLVDQELETLSTQQDCSQYLSTFPPPPFQQQVLPELLQSSLQPGSRGPSVPQHGPVEHISGASSPLDQLSTLEAGTAEEQRSTVDFTHLMNETHEEKPKSPLDLAASGRPSAFQVYKKKDPSHTLSEKGGVMPLKEIVGGARSKLSMPNQHPLGYMPPWNLEAPVFSPRCHGNQGPAFITPVAQTPTHWPSQPRLASSWLRHSPVSQAPLRPSATIPKSWAPPAAPKPPAQQSRLRLEGKVLVLLRGAPGSGKSTLARALVEHNPGGVKLSTDDYFTRNGEYHFEPTALGEAHEWNHKQAKEAFERGANPIIIDNTNLQGWEMRPYVVQALRHGYKVLFREPDTWWKNKPKELERRSKHKVPVETIRRMLNGYERYVTVQSIMGSQMPDFKQHLLRENRSSQLVSSGTPCPDLVGPSELSEGCKDSRPQMFSSLPDVSSMSFTNELGTLEDCTLTSAESLNFHLTGSLKGNSELTNRNDDVDLGGLHSELEAQLQLNPTGDQSIPDCIVESVMNEDHCGDEMPVAFSESIRQRVKREWPSRRSDYDRLEPADLIKDTNQPDSNAKEKERTKEEEAEAVTMLMDFVGDWPTEVSLEQRPVRKREGLKEGNREKDTASENNAKMQSRPNVAELQKRLDLIQTSSSHLSGEESGEKENKEACGSSEGSQDSGSDDSEEKEQNMDRLSSSGSELPDCVLDWKAASNIKELRSDHEEGLQTKTTCITGGNENVLETDRETRSVDLISPFSALSVDSPVLSDTLEADVCPDGVGRNNNEDVVECDDDHTDVDTIIYTDPRAESECSLMSEVCGSPLCEGSVEVGSPFSGGNQERMQRQGRRSGKQCKLALTFTQNCPGTSVSPLECANTAAQSIDRSQYTPGSDVDSNINPDYNSSSSLQPNSAPFESKSEALLLPPSPSPSPSPSPPSSPLVEGCFSQTEPQDFALLWRLNRHNGPNDSGSIAQSYPNHITVLSTDSSRFVPELSSAVSAAVAVHPSSQSAVPYRVVLEKSTQVVERELETTQDRLESLRILSRHFKLVSFDTLEDLYDKCQQDLEWTTNLLLDSGEKFFRDDDFVKENDGVMVEDKKTPGSCGASGKAVETSLCPNVLDEHHPEDWPEGKPTVFEERTNTKSTFGAVSGSDGGSITVSENEDHPVITSNLENHPETEHILLQSINVGDTCVDSKHKEATITDVQGGAQGWSSDDGVIIEESTTEIEDEVASIDEIHRVLQAEHDEREWSKEERQKKEERAERRLMEERRRQPLDIKSVELKLPTEVGLQLAELFGPVGVDPDTCSSEDFAVQLDLNLAKLLHQKWKETIQEKQRLATLSFHLLQQSSVHWGESQASKMGTREQIQPSNFLISADGYASLDNQTEARGQMPFMDHWNTSHTHVSLRDIIKEEQALQENVKKTRQSRADLDRRDGSTLLKESQLFSLFPTIDRHFLLDIFRDHNYSLTQTELFLQSLLDEEPVKTVVAPEAPRSDHHRTASRERDKRQKPAEVVVPHYQDTEDPEYEDFRAEASLQRTRQLESFTKAAEAFKQGRKDVASFYAQQGHLHGKKMREANHRAAVQIFERVNSSLLPKNILDLHGLHVDEALEHLAQVLENKASDCEQGLCRPQLSVITGRGNHSQGGVARIRPAVIDYLTNKHYRFTEPKPGLVLVSLK